MFLSGGNSSRLQRVTDNSLIELTTLQAAIERLKRARIIKRVGNAKRDRVYWCDSSPDNLEEPARLKPLINEVLSNTLERIRHEGTPLEQCPGACLRITSVLATNRPQNDVAPLLLSEAQL
jgi:hypothetical protein